MRLGSLPTGAQFTVTGVETGSPLAFRLMEMGLIEGTEGQVMRRAPLGDPLQLRVGDYHLSLRHNEASLISVAIPTKA